MHRLIVLLSAYPAISCLLRGIAVYLLIITIIYLMGLVKAQYTGLNILNQLSYLLVSHTIELWLIEQPI